jgi:hypothetical protein
LTPPWPEQAPRLLDALVKVPSLQLPVEPAGAAAVVVDRGAVDVGGGAAVGAVAC